MRCPTCQEENPPGSSHCSLCDEDLSVYDSEEHIATYERALQRLIDTRGWNDTVAEQCAKLRQRLYISDEIHEQRLAQRLTLEDEAPNVELALCFDEVSGLIDTEHITDLGLRTWHIPAALINRGGFDLVNVEINCHLSGPPYLTSHATGAVDDGEVHTLPLSFAAARDLQALMIHIRVTDILHEMIEYRSAPIFIYKQHLESLSSKEASTLVTLTQSQLARVEEDLTRRFGDVCAVDEARITLNDLNPQRSYYSILGQGRWVKVPLLPLTEEEGATLEGALTQQRLATSHQELQKYKPGEKHTIAVGNETFDEVYCPSGIGWIGAPIGIGRDWETPRHQVKISKGIWTTSTLITQAIYKEVMRDNPSVFKESTLPVDSVSWVDAIRFCNHLSIRLGLEPVYEIEEPERKKRTPKYITSAKEHTSDTSIDATVSTSDTQNKVITPSVQKVHQDPSRPLRRHFIIRWIPERNGFRLPTESEWEYVACAGLERHYAGSNKPEVVCWSMENAELQSHHVAQLKANSWGIYDMSGNLWEWCFDQFKEASYRHRSDLSTDPITGTFEVHTVADDRRVRRGGSWATNESACRVFTRADSPPNYHGHFIGLRVVRTVSDAIPKDRVSTTKVNLIDLIKTRSIYLIAPPTSSRRAWALRIVSLGLTLTTDFHQAELFIALSGDKHALSEKLYHRALGLGWPVLSETEVDPLFKTIEQNSTQITPSQERWNQLCAGPLFVIGRFQMTQTTLKKELRRAGAVWSTDLGRTSAMIKGGGERASAYAEIFENENKPIFSELEVRTLLDHFAAPQAIPLPDQSQTRSS